LRERARNQKIKRKLSGNQAHGGKRPGAGRPRGATKAAPPKATKQAVIDEVFARMATGESVRQVFAAPPKGFPDERTFWRWLAADDAMQAKYELALRLRADRYAEEIVDIADHTMAGVKTTTKANGDTETVEHDMIEHRRLRVDARKWVAARLLPKKYGDKQTTTLAGDPDAPLIPPVVVIGAYGAAAGKD
jgi:hypothetical protein